MGADSGRAAGASPPPPPGTAGRPAPRPESDPAAQCPLPFIRVTCPSSESSAPREPRHLRPGFRHQWPGQRWLVCPSQAKPVPATNEPAAGQGCFRLCVDSCRQSDAASCRRQAATGLGAAPRPARSGSSRGCCRNLRVGSRGSRTRLPRTRLPRHDCVPAGKREALAR